MRPEPSGIADERSAADGRLRRRLHAAPGARLAIDRVRIRSPFVRVRYDLISTLSIIARHQHRHLWQAGQVARGLTGGAARPAHDGGTTP